MGGQRTNRLSLLSHQLTLDKVRPLGDTLVNHHQAGNKNRTATGMSMSNDEKTRE